MDIESLLKKKSLSGVSVHRLQNRPEYYPILAYWAYQTWHSKRNIDFKAILGDYRRRVDFSELPRTLIAMKNNIPIGMVSLKKYELLNKKDLCPWLSSLYVEPEYRNLGIGSKLIDKIKKNAKKDGYNSLYLFADHYNAERLASYYLKRGWRFLENSKDLENNPVQIFYSAI